MNLNLQIMRFSLFCRRWIYIQEYGFDLVQKLSVIKNNA